jgi:hypothetical protein
MTQDVYPRLLDFLNRLAAAKIAFDLRQSRDDAIMAQVNVPGERWEVEFLAGGEIEVERFRSGGKIEDETSLQTLFDLYSDLPPATEEELKPHDAIV